MLDWVAHVSVLLAREMLHWVHKSKVRCSDEIMHETAYKDGKAPDRHVTC